MEYGTSLRVVEWFDLKPNRLLVSFFSRNFNNLLYTSFLKILSITESNETGL